MSITPRSARQPKNVAKINFSDPITQGLVLAAYPVGSSFYDAVSGLFTSRNSGNNKHLASVDGDRYPAVHGAGASSTGGLFPSATGADKVAGVHSTFAEARLNSNATANYIFRSNDTGTGDGFGIVLDDINSVTNGFYYYANNGARTNSGSGVLGTDSENFAHRIALTVDGTNARYYAKNALARTVAETVLPNANAGRRTTMLGSSGSQGLASCGILLVWSRVISLLEYKRLYDNPYIVFSSRIPTLLSSLSSPQILYPTGDVAGGTWLPSTGTDLFACVDETVASDADYIYTTVPGSYQEFSFADGGAVDPSTGGHVRYRLPAGTGTIVAVLKQGSTTLQTLGTHTLTGSAQDIDVTITASVANSTDLRVGFTASA